MNRRMADKDIAIAAVCDFAQRSPTRRVSYIFLMYDTQSGIYISSNDPQRFTLPLLSQIQTESQFVFVRLALLRTTGRRPGISYTLKSI